MEEKLDNERKTEQAHHAAVGRKNSLTDKAKELLHEVADVTMEMAHEMKEKIVGHVTDKDIANAAQKVADLRAKLANEERQLNEIQLAAEVAEKTLNLQEYEALKEKEIEVKNEEHEIKREIAECEGYYIHLQNAQMLQKRTQKHNS